MEQDHDDWRDTYRLDLEPEPRPVREPERKPEAERRALRQVPSGLEFLRELVTVRLW